MFALLIVKIEYELSDYWQNSFLLCHRAHNMHARFCIMNSQLAQEKCEESLLVFFYQKEKRKVC